ncbi:DNA-binding response OmpR family regulator [Paucibacter oligotrophus]|uniref:DNA-binding response OmpR family regulator n=1 Tax=Roseateles oligotrophus TaxID=1769250 RepID=A0A840L940_9BURK|nr:response regulator [Roseateles oligotrophus]MBB4843273.1 DNA-binding response OmpR family regulator [Roseateles oligotrophus]
MTLSSRVLLVDDDELTLQMLEATLEDAFKVVCVTSGEQALALCANEVFDLVVLDVDMPGLDGYETCRRLKADFQSADIPVIFHSAKVSIDERLQGYAAGGADYLAKPFDPTELQAKISLVLANRDKQRELAGQLDEVMNAVLSTADMVGEAGVVLEYQRQLASCADYAQVARALFEALQRYGLDGCLRIRGRAAALSLNARSPCSALENSILDHLQAQTEGPRIRPLGAHTGFSYGSVLLFVRDLRMDRGEAMDKAVSERMGRAIDNVAMLVEGAIVRVSALDTEMAARELADVRHLVSMTRNALTDISARSQAQKDEVKAIFESLNAEVESSFLHLGLTHSQEDFLSTLLKQHMEAVLTSMGKSQEVEDFLARVILKLNQYS